VNGSKQAHKETSTGNLLCHAKDSIRWTTGTSIDIIATNLNKSKLMVHLISVFGDGAHIPVLYNNHPYYLTRKRDK
jgi:hypothetical protein